MVSPHSVDNGTQPLTEKKKKQRLPLGSQTADLEVKHLRPSLRGHRACSAFSACTGLGPGAWESDGHSSLGKMHRRSRGQAGRKAAPAAQ